MRLPLSVFALLLLAADGAAQTPVQYEISFENRAHHEAEITIHYEDIGPGPLELRMSRTSPGRYALHEFAKNVYNFRATGRGGVPVEVRRPDNHQWTLSGHGGELTVRYTLYGDRADGTYTGIDRSHGHLNMPATFAWARGLEARPIELTVRAPAGSGWRVATQLAATGDPYRFTSPDLAYFLDSPTEVSDFWEKSWMLDGQTIRVALHHAGTDAEAEAYAAAAAAIVEGFRDVYGTLPDFDFGEYVFLADYLPWVAGDGMEHRNSTILTSTGSLERSMTGLLGTVAHEFFHAWNVERIRPATLEPFDFAAANMSDALWFAEGFTSYYDDLILWRAGLIDDAAFGQRMGGIANSVTNAPGRGFFSPMEMSQQAPFVDAATSVDPHNRGNTFLSYYTWGSGVALGLDLEIRTRWDGLTLDHVMREMWRRHGAVEVPYVVSDIEDALATVTGDEAFARDFFDRYVRGREAPDYARLLPGFGVSLGVARPESAWIGSLGPIAADEDGARLTGTPLLGSPLYMAGLDRGDRILRLDGEEVRSRQEIAELLADRDVGQTIPVRFQSRGQEIDAEMTLMADPALAGAWMENADAGARDRRASWKTSSR